MLAGDKFEHGAPQAGAKDEGGRAKPKARTSAAPSGGAEEAASKHINKKYFIETKEDAPVKRGSTPVSFPGARAVLVTATLYLAALFVAATMAPWSHSSMPNGAAEVVTTKFAFSWVNEMQCRLYDKNGFCAVQATGCPTDAAKGLPQSASLDPIESERAGLRAEKKEGVASSDPRAGLYLTTRQQSGRGTMPLLQWVPVLLAIYLGPDESNQYTNQANASAWKQTLADRFAAGDPSVVLIHTHVKKTGGSLLEQLLDIEYSHKNIYGHGAENLPGLISRWAQLNDSQARTGLFPQYRVFNWHIPFGFHHFLQPREPVYIALLREPRARLRSAWEFTLTQENLRAGAEKITYFEWAMAKSKCGHSRLRSYGSCSDNPATRQVCGYSAWLNKEDSTSFTTFLCASSAMDAYYAVVGVNERMGTSLCLLKRVLGWSAVNWEDVRLFDRTRINPSRHFDAVGADALPSRLFKWDSALHRKADERLTEQAASYGCDKSTLLTYYDGQPAHSPGESHGMQPVPRDPSRKSRRLQDQTPPMDAELTPSLTKTSRKILARPMKQGH